MKIIITLLVTFALAGCMQNGVWVKPGATQADFNRDMAACKYDADRSTATEQNGFMQGYETVNLTKECMTVKGYRMESIEAARAEKAARDGSSQ